jgi:8-oxo-dGTP pyrophosphatase MutT (NUDIX family)
VTGSADEPTSDGVIRAAGGVVIGADGRVALVHRPRYDDWSLPKGKLAPGEDAEDGAVRETEEETGFTCRTSTYLRRDSYTDHVGRPKVVDYWLMEPVDGSFLPNDEVDEIRWLEYEQARVLLTYDRDQETLRKGVDAWKASRT